MDKSLEQGLSGTEGERSPGFGRIVWRRLRRDRYAMTGLYTIIGLLTVAYLAPVLANSKPIAMKYAGKTYFPAIAEMFPFNLLLDYPELRSTDFRTLQGKTVALLRTPIPYSPFETSLGEKLQPPSRDHWMGTDTLGRDVCSRVIHGAAIPLMIGFIAVAIAVAIGLTLGSLAGFYGGSIDVLISRFIEVVMCFPVLFLVLAVIAFLPPGILNIMVIIGITRWTGIARYARGEFLRIKNEDYAHAARALGATDYKIIFRHILPNSLAPVLVSATFGIAASPAATSLPWPHWVPM